MATAHSPASNASDAPSEYLSAKEAARLLGVKVASLYSYVSRGLIRSTLQTGTRTRLYWREDVESASKRMGGRAGIPDTVETAVRWGHPMLVSSITEISAEGPIYRGRRALDLIDSGRTYESVAELLWGGMDLPGLTHWDKDPAAAGLLKRIESAVGTSAISNSARLIALVNTVVGLSKSEKPDFERGTTVTEARLFIELYAASMGLLGPTRSVTRLVEGRPLSETLARSLLGEDAPALDAAAANINAALILCADHELSPATLAARVAASAGADLVASLNAGIATHSGTRLGGGCDRAEDLLSGAKTLDDLKRSITALEKAGRTVPGFNLVAYPKGDPRARFLLQMAASSGAMRPSFKRFANLLSEAEKSFDLHPSIEVGLVGLCMSMGLPRRSATALWAIGRCAGWVAHVVEQRQAGFMLRPRAKYVSPV